MSKKLSFYQRILTILLFVTATQIQARGPVWTITPLTNTHIAIPANASVVVQYRITNQSTRPHTLQMQPIQGVTQITDGLGTCKSSFILAAKGSSCVLSLQINGGPAQGGPIICQQGNPNQCYQPSQADILQVASLPTVAVGQAFGGGIVACLDGGSQNFIAALSDQEEVILPEWGGENVVTNANSDGDGATNTQTIVNVLGNNSGTPYAAQICANYKVDSAGNSPCQAGNTCYSDWFLPAKNQLNCLYINRALLGEFVEADYWSSTEVNAQQAWGQSFFNGDQNPGEKFFGYDVRCVRPITP